MKAKFSVFCLSVLICSLFACSKFSKTGESETSGYFLKESLWQKKSLSVCWTNPDESNASDRQRVRDRITDTWQAYSAIRFTGWNTCSNAMQSDIKLAISDEGPAAWGLGKFNRLTTLNFTFKNWSPICANSEARRIDCLETNAIHEFGHILGIAHEHHRSSRSVDCVDENQGTDGDTEVGPFDRESIMNYCFNSSYSNKLSPIDIRTIQKMYGAPAKVLSRDDFKVNVVYDHVEAGQMNFKIRIDADKDALDQVDFIDVKFSSTVQPIRTQIKRQDVITVGYWETPLLKTAEKVTKPQNLYIVLKSNREILAKPFLIDWRDFPLPPVDQQQKLVWTEVAQTSYSLKAGESLPAIRFKASGSAEEIRYKVGRLTDECHWDRPQSLDDTFEISGISPLEGIYTLDTRKTLKVGLNKCHIRAVAYTSSESIEFTFTIKIMVEGDQDVPLAWDEMPLLDSYVLGAGETLEPLNFKARSSRPIVYSHGHPGNECNWDRVENLGESLQFSGIAPKQGVYTTFGEHLGLTGLFRCNIRAVADDGESKIEKDISIYISK